MFKFRRLTWVKHFLAKKVKNFQCFLGSFLSYMLYLYQWRYLVAAKSYP